LNSDFLIVALGCGQYKGALELALKNPFVVFGTMHGGVFAKLAAKGIPGSSDFAVYFYETG
jgi:hypothetical protein